MSVFQDPFLFVDAVETRLLRHAESAGVHLASSRMLCFGEGLHLLAIQRLDETGGVIREWVVSSEKLVSSSAGQALEIRFLEKGGALLAEVFVLLDGSEHFDKEVAALGDVLVATCCSAEGHQARVDAVQQEAGMVGEGNVPFDPNAPAVDGGEVVKVTRDGS